MKAWPDLSPYLPVGRLDKKRQLEGDDTMFLVFEGPDSTLARALLNASIVLALSITFCLAPKMSESIFGTFAAGRSGLGYSLAIS